MILKIEKKEQLVDILNCFKPYLESLKNGVVCIEDIATKFFMYATIAVLYQNNKIIGFISFYCNNTDNRTAFISLIAVLPEYTKKGFGKKLMEEAFEYCKNKEMKYIRLEVKKNNINALTFYQKFGFKIEKSETDYSIYLTKSL